MKRAIYRWMAGAATSVVLIAAAGTLWVYAASEAHLRSFPLPPAFSQPVPTDSAAIARGDHLVRTRGCRGCHGDNLQGQVMWDYAVAPNLGELARERNAASFEAALRHGIGHDGKALYSMPSFSFIRLRDNDVADMIAYMRSLPAQRIDLPRAILPWSIRWEIARGADEAIAGFLAQVPPLRDQHDPDPRIARGEYLAMTTCIECHGFNLRGVSPFGDAAPDLVVIMGYDEAAFTKLMRNGIALGDRELERMSKVARSRFATLTDEEIRDLYAFLKAMATRDFTPPRP